MVYLEKYSNGNVLLKDSSTNDIKAVFQGNTPIFPHPRDSKLILISNDPTNQTDNEDYIISWDNIDGGSSFPLMTITDRNSAINQLSRHMFYPEPENKSYYIGRGAYVDARPITIYGTNYDIDIGSPQTLWNQSGVLTSLSSGNVDYFISSSSSSDTGLILINSIDENGAELNIPITLNGQNQVSVPTQFENSISITSTVELIGDVYLYTTSTTTSGVPDDLTSINDKISIINTQSQGQSTKFWYQVPVGCEFSTEIVNLYTGKNKDVEFSINFQIPGLAVIRKSIQLYETTHELNIDPHIILPALSILSMDVSTSSNNTSGTAVLTGVLHDVI